MCNGEIYGFRPLRRTLSERYEFRSGSDCEILLPMFREYGLSMFARLDAEFALIIYDSMTDSLIAARDPIGIRPLFYGYYGGGDIVFASEARNLAGLCAGIFSFPPGHYYAYGRFIRYADPTEVKTCVRGDLDTVCRGIRNKLIAAVDKRLDADAPLGFLLSGGLDSSLVCAISSVVLGRSIRTFAIGMYLCCKAIHERTDIRVLLTGEVSDELFGYKYTDFALSAEDFHRESQKRIEELYMYDVLRADRCIADNSIEARVPFGDLDFVNYVMSIDPAMKRNAYGVGKYLLRRAFENDRLLPESILWREKAAFSDAVGHSMADDLKAYAETVYTDEAFDRKRRKYGHCMPFTKESLLYRGLFEQVYPGQARIIRAFWMPNRDWEGCDVNDPSARVLPNYGQSGA